VILNQKNMPKAKLRMGLILSCQTKGEVTKFTDGGLVISRLEQQTKSTAEKTNNAGAGCI
jgi:hypothetical protein